MNTSLEERKIFLNSDELAILEEDGKRREKVIGILESIKGMDGRELDSYSDFCPVDVMHYRAVHTAWLEKARYLLGTRIGRSPNSLELKKDIEKNNTAKRFQAFYSLMHSEFVRKR